MAALSDLSMRLLRLSVSGETSAAQKKQSIFDQIGTIIHLIPRDPFEKKHAKDYLEMLRLHTDALRHSSISLENSHSQESLSTAKSVIDSELKPKKKPLCQTIEGLDLETPLFVTKDSTEYYDQLPLVQLKSLDYLLCQRVHRFVLGIKDYVEPALRLVESEQDNPLILKPVRLPSRTKFFVLQRMLNISYTPRKPLGSGSYGKVFLLGSTHHSFAYKRPLNEASAIQTLRNEALIYMQLDHPHIIKLKGVTDQVKPPEIDLIMEFIRGDALIELVDTHFAIQDLINILLQIADAVSYLHEQGFIHKDLKLDNVMYDPLKKKCKLFDFGLTSPKEGYQRTSGTYFYMAPELLSISHVKRRSEKVDSWSFGVICFQFLSKGMIPFPKLSVRESKAEFHSRIAKRIDQPCRFEELFDQKDRPKHLYEKKHSSPCFLELANLIIKCLHGSPEERPSMREILGFLRSIKTEPDSECGIL